MKKRHTSVLFILGLAVMLCSCQSFRHRPNNGKSTDNVSFYRIPVDYRIALEDATKKADLQCDKSDWEECAFPREQKNNATLEMAIVYYSEPLTTGEVIARMKGNGWRPATLDELLAFAIAHPEYPPANTYRIMALGSPSHFGSSKKDLIPNVQVFPGLIRFHSTWGEQWGYYLPPERHLSLVKEQCGELWCGVSYLVVRDPSTATTDTGDTTKAPHFTVTVDYDLPLSKAAERCGFDTTHTIDFDREEKRYPAERSGVADCEMAIFYFGRLMTTDAVMRELKTHGFRPATLRELLAFAAANPAYPRTNANGLVSIGSFFAHADHHEDGTVTRYTTHPQVSTYRYGVHPAHRVLEFPHIFGDELWNEARFLAVRER